MNLKIRVTSLHAEGDSNNTELKLPYKPGLTVKDLLETLTEKYKNDSDIMKITTNLNQYLIVLDGKNIKHREGLDSLVKDGSLLVFLLPMMGG